MLLFSECKLEFIADLPLLTSRPTLPLVAPERGDVCRRQAEGFSREYQTILTKFVQTWFTPLSLRDISPFRGDKGRVGRLVSNGKSATNRNLILA